MLHWVSDSSFNLLNNLQINVGTYLNFIGDADFIYKKSILCICLLTTIFWCVALGFLLSN